MKALSILLFFSIATPAYAIQEIHFTSDDLAAIIHLAKPERSILVVDGLEGKFTPGPSLEFAGMQEQTFKIDMNIGGGLVDLKFNHFQALPPTLRFLPDQLQIDIPVKDQEKVIQSRFGSISVKGVKLVGTLGFRNGNADLVWIGSKLEGQMKGSGLLKPKWVMDAIKKTALKTLKSEVEKQLNRPDVRTSLEEALMGWAKISELPKAARIVPGSIQVIQGISAKTEIKYEVE